MKGPLLLVILLAFTSQGFGEAQEPSTKVALVRFSGDFVGEKTSGLLERWVFYSDGTVEGKWTNPREKTSVPLAGTYAVDGDHIHFMVGGTLVLPPNEKSHIEVSGSGSYSHSQCSGVYSFFDGNRKRGNDCGKFSGRLSGRLGGQKRDLSVWVE